MEGGDYPTLYEIEGTDEIDKLVQMDAVALRTASAVDLGMPTFTKIAGRLSAT